MRSSLVAISFGSSQQLVGGDVSSSRGGEGRSCRRDVGMADTGAAEKSRYKEDDIVRRPQPGWVWPFVLTRGPTIG
jgi:hypothetical protein